MAVRHHQAPQTSFRHTREGCRRPRWLRFARCAENRTRMTRDEELWGMALMMLRQHDDKASSEVAGRIARLAHHGEDGGVALWQAVAHRLDDLIAGRHAV